MLYMHICDIPFVTTAPLRRTPSPLCRRSKPSSSPGAVEVMGKMRMLPSGKHTKNYGKSPFSMGKSAISTGPFSIVEGRLIID